MRPLAERFGLAPASGSHAFPVFRGERGWGIVAGPGKAAAAAATAYLHLLSGGSAGQVWLSVGAGGHAVYPVGEAVIAHKILDPASGRSCFPPLVVDLPFRTAPLLSVERLEEPYAPPYLHETTAAGFYGTACRFATAELVQCVRLVSDTPESTLVRLSTHHVERHLRPRLEGIASFAEALLGLARELAAVEDRYATLAAHRDRSVPEPPHAVH